MTEHTHARRQRRPVPGALIGWIFGLFNLINPLVASAVLATPITG